MITNAPPPTANQNQIGTPSGYVPNKVKSVNSEASSVVGIDVVEFKVPVDSFASLVGSIVIVDDDVIVATDSIDSIREDFSVEVLEIVDIVVVSVSDVVVDVLVMTISTSEVVGIEVEVGIDSWDVWLSESSVLVFEVVDNMVSITGSVAGKRLSGSYKQALMIHSS